MKHLLHLALLFIIATTSCKKAPISNLSEGDLVEAKDVKTITKSECIQLANETDISLFAQYDVKLVELVYITEYDGKRIETSGMLFLPVGKDTVHFVNYNHGTVVPLKLLGMDDDTPSLYHGQNSKFLETRNIGLAWASAGYTVFMPDYVGYNRTKGKEHPFVYYPELVKSIYYGNIAAKSYFSKSNLDYDNRLFLAGWSQGGGAALATHRFIQEYASYEFQVVASLNLSGPYNFKRFIQSVMDKKDEFNDKLNIYSWALYSMNKFSGLKRANDRFYSYPVYDQVTAFNPPAKIPSKIFNIYFIKQITEGGDTEVQNIIAKNTYSSGWTPQGKVFFYHGNQDDYVPYFNSEDAYNGLSQTGADVSLITYDGDDHYTVFKKYLIDAKNQLDLLK